METLRIKEALLIGGARRGEKITHQELGKVLWPESSADAQRTNISKLVNGGVKRVDIQMVSKLCEVLHVDANFLFGIKPM